MQINYRPTGKIGAFGDLVLHAADEVITRRNCIPIIHVFLEIPNLGISISELALHRGSAVTYFYSSGEKNFLVNNNSYVSDISQT